MRLRLIPSLLSIPPFPTPLLIFIPKQRNSSCVRKSSDRAFQPIAFFAHTFSLDLYFRFGAVLPSERACEMRHQGMFAYFLSFPAHKSVYEIRHSAVIVGMNRDELTGEEWERTRNEEVNVSPRQPYSLFCTFTRPQRGGRTREMGWGISRGFRKGPCLRLP